MDPGTGEGLEAKKIELIDETDNNLLRLLGHYYSSSVSSFRGSDHGTSKLMDGEESLFSAVHKVG